MATARIYIFIYDIAQEGLKLNDFCVFYRGNHKCNQNVFRPFRRTPTIIPVVVITSTTGITQITHEIPEVMLFAP